MVLPLLVAAFLGSQKTFVMWIAPPGQFLYTLASIRRWIRGEWGAALHDFHTS
jgi:hypothetical protein